MHAYTCPHAHPHTHTHAHIHTLTHTDTHAHTHTLTHTHSNFVTQCKSYSRAVSVSATTTQTLTQLTMEHDWLFIHNSTQTHSPHLTLLVRGRWCDIIIPKNPFWRLPLANDKRLLCSNHHIHANSFIITLVTELRARDCPISSPRNSPMPCRHTLRGNPDALATQHFTYWFTVMASRKHTQTQGRPCVCHWWWTGGTNSNHESKTTNWEMLLLVTD